MRHYTSCMFNDLTAHLRFTCDSPAIHLQCIDCADRIENVRNAKGLGVGGTVAQKSSLLTDPFCLDSAL